AIWFGNLHKYPCAPRGAAVLVAQGDLAQQLYPVIDSWGTNDPFPDRFDIQGAVDNTGFLASVHAIDTLEKLFGWANIRQYSARLATAATEIVAPQLGYLLDKDPVVDVGVPVAEQALLRLPSGVASNPDGARLLKDRLATDAQCE